MQRTVGTRDPFMIHAGWHLFRKQKQINRNSGAGGAEPNFSQTDRESHLTEAIIIISKFRIQTVMPDGRK